VNYAKFAALLLPLLIAPMGCIAVAGEEGEALGWASSEAVIGNALSANALSANALSANALSANALSANALSPGTLGVFQAPGADGDLSRRFLRYTVSCALAPSSSFWFSWTDSAGTVHNESYPGELGLAPGWATGSLGTAGEQMVSACLAARTNWYGVSVTISMRSAQDPLRTLTTDDERAEFGVLEGTFWGNLFSSTPHLSACYDDRNVESSRDARRDCAAGHVSATGAIQECGMIHIVGACAHTCRLLNASYKQYYSECNEGTGTTSNVITTALP
jgi:hypothetical protein